MSITIPQYVELWWELVGKRQARKGAPAVDVAVRQLCSAPFVRGTPDEQPKQPFGFAPMKRALWFRKAALSSLVDSLVRPAKKLTDPGEPLLRCLRQAVAKHKTSPILASAEEFGRYLTSPEGRTTLSRLGINEDDVAYLGPVIGVYSEEILWLAPTLDEAVIHAKVSRTRIALLRRPMQIVIPELPEWARARRHEIAAMKENDFIDTSRLLLRATLPETITITKVGETFDRMTGEMTIKGDDEPLQVDALVHHVGGTAAELSDDVARHAETLRQLVSDYRPREVIWQVNVDADEGEKILGPIIASISELDAVTLGISGSESLALKFSQLPWHWSAAIGFPGFKILDCADNLESLEHIYLRKNHPLLIKSIELVPNPRVTGGMTYPGVNRAVIGKLHAGKSVALYQLITQKLYAKTVIDVASKITAEELELLCQVVLHSVLPNCNPVFAIDDLNEMRDETPLARIMALKEELSTAEQKATLLVAYLSTEHDRVRTLHHHVFREHTWEARVLDPPFRTFIEAAVEKYGPILAPNLNLDDRARVPDIVELADNTIGYVIAYFKACDASLAPFMYRLDQASRVEWQKHYRELLAGQPKAAALIRLIAGLRHLRILDIDLGFARAAFAGWYLKNESSASEFTDAVAYLEQEWHLRVARNRVLIDFVQTDPEAIGMTGSYELSWHMDELMEWLRASDWPRDSTQRNMVLQEIATTYERCRYWDKLERALRQVMKEFPNDLRAVRRLGEFLAKSNRLEEGLPHLERYMAQAPNDYYVWLDLMKHFFYEPLLDRERSVDMLRRLAGIEESYTLAVGYLIDMFAREWREATNAWRWFWKHADVQWKRTLCLYVLVVLAEGGRIGLIEACVSAIARDSLSEREKSYIETIRSMSPDGIAGKWGAGLWERRAHTDLILILPNHELTLEIPRGCCPVVKMEPCTNHHCPRHSSAS